MSGGFEAFVQLYEALDTTTSINGKREALEAYFRGASDADLAWAVFALTGRRLRRLLSSAHLRDWASEHTGLPAWLVEASYDTVGDLAETLAILCSRGARGGHVRPLSLATFIEEEVLPLSRLESHEQREQVLRWWNTFDEPTCLVVHKVVMGGFRVGVSATMVVRALAGATSLPASAIEHRLMGPWDPTPAFGAWLRAGEDARADQSRPYPFFLASPLEGAAEPLGARDEWQAEWKWDGIRAQLIVRGGEVFLWSRGEELLTGRFPEIAAAARALPDGTVLDGEILIVRGDRVQPFSVLQTRIGRKSLSPRLLRDAPAFFFAFDLIEREAIDRREEPLAWRRRELESLLRSSGSALRLSETLVAPDWASLAALRESSRARGVEGLMLKRLASPYRSGRPRGDWWKWKVSPYTMDAVLVYAQAGHGKRAAQYTDYTFAVWDGDALVPVAKAYSGLDNDEIARLDAWIRAHTTERFGPVRSVEPVHVFELGFEAIQRSTRHKAGIAVRSPRILRWRRDKPVREANTLDDLRHLIAAAAVENPARAVAPSPPLPSLFDADDPRDE